MIKNGVASKSDSILISAPSPPLRWHQDQSLPHKYIKQNVHELKIIQFCGNNFKGRTDKCRSSALLLVVRTLAHPLFFPFSVCLSDRQPPPIHRCRKIGQLCRLCRLFWAISPIFDARHCAGSSGFPVWAETSRQVWRCIVIEGYDHDRPAVNVFCTIL